MPHVQIIISNGFDISNADVKYIILVSFLAIWDLVWKWIAMYKAGENKNPVWFVCIFALNTVWILPIIYLILSKKKHNKK